MVKYIDNAIKAIVVKIDVFCKFVDPLCKDKLVMK